MATTTFRLTPDDERILDLAAERYGSRSAAIRALLQDFDAEERRRTALRDVRREWEAEVGPADPPDVEALRTHLERP